MPDANDLLNDPVGFMRDNIVIVSGTGNNAGADFDVVGGVHNLTLYTLPPGNERGQKKERGHAAVGVFHLHLGPMFNVQAIVDPVPIPAYFCPYDANHTFGTIITNGADLMFTTQMDGCTFGVGSRAPDGSRLVYHTNSFDPNPVTQATNQAQNLVNAFATHHTGISGTLAPADYRVSRGGRHYKATTFGVRDNGTNRWRFFVQRYAPKAAAVLPMVFVLKELRQLNIAA